MYLISSAVEEVSSTIQFFLNFSKKYFFKKIVHTPSIHSLPKEQSRWLPSNTNLKTEHWDRALAIVWM